MGNNTGNNVVSINTCKSCGKILRAEWKFCPFCATGTEIVKCPFCGKEISKSWRFCAYCTIEIRDSDRYDSKIDMGNDWLVNILKSKGF